MDGVSSYVDWFREGGEALIEQRSGANAFLLYNNTENTKPLQYKTNSFSDVMPFFDRNATQKTLQTQRIKNPLLSSKPPQMLIPNTELVVQPLAKSTRNPFTDQLTIGRATNNDVVLKLPSVSKFHAWLKILDGGYRLFDAKSTFGTFVEGTRATEDGHTGIMLASGNRVRLGELDLLFLDTAGLVHWLQEKGALKSI